MTDRIAIISSEITVDPLVRGYSAMSNKEVADDMSETAYRPADGGVADMIRYLATHDNRTNEGGDTNATLMLGRLRLVAESEPYTDPFHRAGVWEAGGSGTNEQIELDATNNKLIFGSAHDVSSLNAKDAIRLSGSTADDGTQQIVSISLQEVTVTSITVAETLERVFRVFKVQDSKLLTNEQIQNARALLQLFSLPQIDNIDSADTEIDLAFQDMETAGVWKAADTAALKNFSLSQQTRGVELGVGRVREGDVAAARA